MKAPKFWTKKGILAWMLYPFSLVYGPIALSRMTKSAQYKAHIPVLCIGNLVVGGAGKTPTALAISKAARKIGLSPVFLTRGYGGKEKGPLWVDPEKHSMADVGDEALLLARTAPTIVSVDRVKGAKLAEQSDATVIIMDDGFQNPYLYKDFNLIVVDAQQAIGNGFTLPAGPLRAPLTSQVRNSDQFLLVGKGDSAPKLRQIAAKLGKSSSHAYLKPAKTNLLEGTRVLALSGIGRPEKFYETLESLGLEIVDKMEFGDHHPYTSENARKVINRAGEQNLEIVTTSKDHVRFLGLDGAAIDFLEKAHVINVEMEFDDSAFPRLVLEQAQRKFTRR